jgi:hypothetical protein
MQRISNSIALAKSSWAVLKADKELALIPVLSFLATLAVMALAGGGVYFSLTEKVTQPGNTTSMEATPLTYVVGALGYLAITFVVTYFAAVLVSGAHQRLTGGNPTLGTAFTQASSRLGPILAWSLLTGTVGLILQAIRSRAGFLGQIVVNLVGMAWEIVTWLAVPVVVVEGTGAIDSLKRSASLFKKTWGENLVAQGGFGILGLVLMVPAVIIMLLVVRTIPIAGLAIAGLWVAVVSVVLSALNGIYRTALYMYAAGEPTAGYFSHEQLDAAFKPKKRSGLL